MLEKQIEQKLVKKVKSIGGLAIKLVSPGFAGMPDRIILLPGGGIAFTEIKRMGCKLRPLQIRRKRQLEKLGFLVYVIDSEEKIDQLIP
jgi:hypothetical protein